MQIEIDENATVDRLIEQHYLAEADAGNFEKIEDALSRLIGNFCHGVTLTR
ncbi:MAG: hypothetical protein ACOZAM_23165 [Pseudomonadota bacterium]